MKQILKSGEAEVIVKKSRFIGEAHRITSEEEAAALVAETRKKYYDARHVCYAYSFGDTNPRLKFSDDGEPKGTAGKPILDIVNGSGVQDILIIVTRYFGGILLGTGGLVRAYSDAAKEALLAAETGELVDCVMRRYSGIAYGDYDKVRFILEKNGITDYETEYGSEVAITAYIPAQLDDGITGEITDSTRGTCTPENLGTMRVVRNTESLNEA
jgi:uncharacterized YigZ family protein